ncbi:helix-turn-helix domain-containing protein [Streptomyces sp. NPDC086782]|uniref:helix-turn-helix domain-containing protein n=1 Tax=Streptomyces sp. NPDC086782 TaxID=3365757 RepID=UPI0037F105F0
MTRSRLDGAERRRIALKMQADYYAGSSLRNLVDRTGWSYGTVRNLLLSVGTDLRKRGGVKGVVPKRNRQKKP